MSKMDSVQSSLTKRQKQCVALAALCWSVIYISVNHSPNIKLAVATPRPACTDMEILEMEILKVGNGKMETVPAKNKQHCYILKLPAKWLLEKRSVHTPIS